MHFSVSKEASIHVWSPHINNLHRRNACHYLFVNTARKMEDDLSSSVTIGGHPEVTVFGRGSLIIVWGTECYLECATVHRAMFTVTRWCVWSQMVEKYQFQGFALTQKNCVGCTSFSIEKSLRRSHALYLSSPCRAGYLTLFGAEQNNNSTDPSSVYEEYKKFEGLLTKLARGTLKAGNDQGSLWCVKALQENKCQQSTMMDIGYTSWPLQPMSHDSVVTVNICHPVAWHHSWCWEVAMEGFSYSGADIASPGLAIV